MSRIGIKPISVPDSVTVAVEPTEIVVHGPLGEMKVALPYGITITNKDKQLFVERHNETKIQKSLHGTVRSLLFAAVMGVLEGFEKKLEMVGIGYRAAIEGNDLVLSVGFSHPVKLTIPEGLKAKIEKNVITVNGIDKQKVGQFAAVIRDVKKPEPYKGKGIRYQGEIVRMKQGKAVKSGA
jgi:large subunit ribosomal protein L6